MTPRNLPQRAVIIETLLYYEEPQLLLLETDRRNRMLAVAVHRKGSDLAFFGCEVKDKAYAKYMDGRADLHYAFSNCLRDKYYFFDLATASDRTVELVPATAEEVSDPHFWPEIGIFSRTHTSSFGKDLAVGNGEELLQNPVTVAAP